MQSYLISKKSQKKENRTILGHKFINEDSFFLDTFATLLTKRDNIHRDLDEKLQIDLSKDERLKDCHQFQCALEILFEEDTGIKEAYILTKFGFNTSHYPKEYAKPFSSHQLDTIISAMNSMPSFFMPMYKEKQLILVDEKKLRIKEGTVANATIELFETWTTYNDEMKEYIVFHELSHNISSLFKINTNSHWHALSGWIKKNKKWEITFPERAVSEYATVSHSEDFAESLSAYRYNPNYLKKVDAKKYNFIKTAVFFGIEFLDEKNCHQVTTFKEIDNIFNSFESTQNKADSVFKKGECLIEHFRYFFGESDQSAQLDSCVVNNYFKEENKNKNLGLSFLFENYQNYEKYRTYKVAHKFSAYENQNDKLKEDLLSSSEKFFEKVTPNRMNLKEGGCYPMFYSIDRSFESYIKGLNKYEYAGYFNNEMIKYCKENFKTLKNDPEDYLMNYLDSRPRKNF